MVDLLDPTSGVQEHAALALAEASVEEKSVKELVGELGGIASLREVLGTLPAEDSVLAAAAVAIGVLCRDFPANACLLLEREDLGSERPPRLPGLERLLESESETNRLAADEVRCCIENVYHTQSALNLKFDSGTKMYRINSEEFPADSTLKLARHVMKGVFENNVANPWGDLLPHIIVKQLLVSRNMRVNWWGLSLLLATHRGEAADEAMKAGSLSPLMELLNSNSRFKQVIFLPCLDSVACF